MYFKQLYLVSFNKYLFHFLLLSVNYEISE